MKQLNLLIECTECGVFTIPHDSDISTCTDCLDLLRAEADFLFEMMERAAENKVDNCQRSYELRQMTL